MPKLDMKEKDMIHIMIEKELKQDLLNEAKSKGMNLNTYIRYILIERNK